MPTIQLAGQECTINNPSFFGKKELVFTSGLRLQAHNNVVGSILWLVGRAVKFEGVYINKSSLENLDRMGAKGSFSKEEISQIINTIVPNTERQNSTEQVPLSGDEELINFVHENQKELTETNRGIFPKLPAVVIRLYVRNHSGPPLTKEENLALIERNIIIENYEQAMVEQIILGEIPPSDVKLLIKLGLKLDNFIPHDELSINLNDQFQYTLDSLRQFPKDEHLKKVYDFLIQTVISLSSKTHIQFRSFGLKSTDLVQGLKIEAGFMHESQFEVIQKLIDKNVPMDAIGMVLCGLSMDEIIVVASKNEKINRNENVLKLILEKEGFIKEGVDHIKKITDLLPLILAFKRTHYEESDNHSLQSLLEKMRDENLNNFISLLLFDPIPDTKPNLDWLESNKDLVLNLLTKFKDRKYEFYFNAPFHPFVLALLREHGQYSEVDGEGDPDKIKFKFSYAPNNLTIDYRG